MKDKSCFQWNSVYMFSFRMPVAAVCRDCMFVQAIVLPRVNEVLYIMLLGRRYDAYSDRPLYLFVLFFFCEQTCPCCSVVVCVDSMALFTVLQMVAANGGNKGQCKMS